MRFHLLGLAHVPTHRDSFCCAYTQKVVKLARMLYDNGHYVIFYGVQGSDVSCNEFVQVLDKNVLDETYGERDWKTECTYPHAFGDPVWTAFNANAAEEISKLKKPRDFILFPFGTFHKFVADAHPDLMHVESGIGYPATFAPYRVFESYAWMHYVYGRQSQDDGKWYDCVIPNCFDLADFPFQPIKQDYLLYMGRIVKRKGVELCVEIAQATGLKLIMAGQGSLANQVEGLDLQLPPNVEFIGPVGPEGRATLMGNARALLCPTYYVEPFGGVAVEAMMCGTPVITTDWGAFSETLQHGMTGFRCRTLSDFVQAVANANSINPLNCRNWAVSRFSLEVVWRQYEVYFKRLYDLWNAGWYKS